MNNALNYSTELKTKYGANFFTNELRGTGAPLTVSDNNQIFGMLETLLTILRNKRDNSNEAIIAYIDDISNLRTDNDRAESLRLLENLGLNNRFASRTAPPPTNVSLNAPPQISENTEKVSYLTGLPQDAECVICQEKINGSGYATGLCRTFYHKQCLDTWCLNKNNCPCPMCRRALRFINNRGGKKRRTKKNRQSKKKKKSHKKIKVSRKR